MSVKDIVTVEALLRQRARRVVTVPIDKSLQATVALMRAEDVEAVVVADFCATEGEGVWGVLTRQNVIDALADKGLAALAAPVGRVKTGGSIYCDVRESVDELVDAMRRCAARHAVVMDRDMVVGMIDASEILFSHHMSGALASGAGGA